MVCADDPLRGMCAMRSGHCPWTHLYKVLLWKPRLSCPACNGSRWGLRLDSC